MQTRSLTAVGLFVRNHQMIGAGFAERHTPLFPSSPHRPRRAMTEPAPVPAEQVEKIDPPVNHEEESDDDDAPLENGAGAGV